MSYPYAMKPTTLLAFAALCFLHTANAYAQPSRPTFSLHEEPLLGERGLSRVLYWNDVTDSPIAAVSVEFGRPLWNRQLDDPARFDLLTKGKVWRLGSDYWTSLDNNVPIKIAGREIPVGLWFLGLQRSADGASWSLAFIDPVKVRKARLDAHAMSTAPIEFQVPLKIEPSTAFADKFTMVLAADKANIKNVTIRISWGKLQLTTPMQVLVAN